MNDPVRFGCFDVGSNAVRFVIAEYTGPDHPHIVFRQRKAIRLASTKEISYSLNHEAMEQVIQFLKEMVPLLHQWNVTGYRAVATSAVRESINGQNFCSRIRQETSIHLQIIPEEEETRLVYIALKQIISLRHQDWLLLDVGGGSVQVALINDSGILWTKSSPIGAVRLWEKVRNIPNPLDFLNRFVRQKFTEMGFPVYPEQNGVSHPCISTGGSLEEITRLIGMITHKTSLGRIRIDQIREMKQVVESLSVEERISTLSMSPDRADIIVPALVLVEQFCSLTHVEILFVPFISLRDGVLLELSGNYYRSLHKQSG